jgi:manganese-dependent inorganic pyrophosphatase
LGSIEENKMMTTSGSYIYVIGHVNPDMDSIAAALGYAWLLKERDGLNTIAARAGAINPQTAWVLKFLKVDPPTLLTDASPRFESVMRRMDTTTPDQPLREAWSIANRTGGIAPILNPDRSPYGLVTGRSLFGFLSHLVGPNPKGNELKVADILTLPCSEAADKNVGQFQSSTRIRDVINRVLRAEGDEFWVLDDDQKYAGICRQKDLLEPPRLKIILVDHNEAQQSVASLDEAELIEILDHHRLGNPPTHTPIRFTVDTVGSTSTLISELTEEAGLSLPPNLAGILMAGLLSDTLILSSPTTTQRDRKAADRLSRWAFIAGTELEGETVQTFGHRILSASAGLGARPASELIIQDMKIYSSDILKFAISQIEVNDMYEIGENVEILQKALKDLKIREGLDFAMLMVTDVVQGASRIMMVDEPVELDDLPYNPMVDGTFLAEGVVSRKKQLLPVVLGLLED